MVARRKANPRVCGRKDLGDGAGKVEGIQDCERTSNPDGTIYLQSTWTIQRVIGPSRLIRFRLG